MLESPNMKAPIPTPWTQSFISRPQVVWQNFLLSTNPTGAQTTLNLNGDEIYFALNELRPQAKLLEIFELLSFFKKQSIDFKPESLAKAYEFHWSEYHQSFFEIFGSLPKNFNQWAKEKNFQINDLRPLILVYKNTKSPQEWTEFFPVLDALITNQTSHSEGKQILELCADLYFQISEKPLEKILPKSKISPQIWLKRLKKLRYPLADEQESLHQNFILQKAWSNPCKYKRQGDRKGFELTVFIASLSDITKARKNLQKSLDELESFYQGEKND